MFLLLVRSNFAHGTRAVSNVWRDSLGVRASASSKARTDRASVAVLESAIVRLFTPVGDTPMGGGLESVEAEQFGCLEKRCRTSSAFFGVVRSQP